MLLLVTNTSNQTPHFYALALFQTSLDNYFIYCTLVNILTHPMHLCVRYQMETLVFC